MWYTHPLLTQGAGRIKTDPLNEERINSVLNRYEEWAKKNNLNGNLKYNVNESQMNRSKFLFPLAGFAVILL